MARIPVAIGPRNHKSKKAKKKADIRRASFKKPDS